MDLANLGLTGLTAAQANLMTTGHNINNAATPGFNRQTVLVSTAGATSTGSGYIGRGVQVDSVQRSYDGFLFNQLVGAQTKGASIAAYGGEIAQVNNLFGDRTVGISPALQSFFDGIQAVASAPADTAARQELLGRSSSLVGQINDASSFLNSQRNNINTQITTVVTQINSTVQRIQDLNHQITIANAGNSGQPPNDLLDQRDQAISDLNNLVNVKVIEQDGKVNLTVGNGQVLLGGDTVFPLSAVASADDPSRTVVAYTTPSGPNGATTSVELRDSAITGGTLGGLMSYRSQTLDAVQNDLGRMAAGLAMSVNQIHTQGTDLNNVKGGDFFTLGDPKVIAARGNSPSTSIVAKFDAVPGPDPANPLTGTDVANKLTGLDYRIDYNGSTYSIADASTGKQVAAGITDITARDLIPGLTLSLSAGTPNAGDSWLVQPTRNSAADLKLAISDPAKIAAAQPAAGMPAGSADGTNALALAQLQTSKTLGGGTMSLNEAYSQLVNKIGVQTQQNSTSATAQQTLIQQNYAAQQAVSGVNLNEEYVNLNNYQQQFQAASRLIDVSSKLFDTLLSMGA